MTPTQHFCRLDLIRLFVNDKLSASEQSALEEYLDRCATCRAAMDEYVAGPQSWQDARLYLAEQAKVEDDRAVGMDVECYHKLLGPTDDPAMIGRVGSYEVVGILGTGGMGVVFKAFDRSLNRFVAIKMLSPLYSGNGTARQRFVREAQSAAAVIHDNVIAIHSIDQWQGSPYLVMTYIRGESLRSRLGRRGALSVREVLRVGAQIAAGLAAAHSQGLIHRDIKPANILLESAVDRLTILDFGLARSIDDVRLTKSDMLLGTPQYMSPEQARDEVLDHRTDLFSLGSVLYEACTGRPPFLASTSYGVIRRIVESQPPPMRQLNSETPEWLEQLVGRLMEKDRDQRFASAAEVESLLRKCLAHLEQPLTVPLPAELQFSRFPIRRFVPTHWRTIMTTSLIALSLAGALVSSLSDNFGPAAQGPDVRSSRERTPAAGTAAESKPSARVGDYRMEVAGVGDVSEMKMTTEFDLSRMKVNQQMQAFENSANGGSVGGAAGTAGGGFGAKFLKPNMGIAFKIEPTKAVR